MNTFSPRIGILGGMGPLATADFFSKLTRATPAVRDQDHFAVTIESASQIPDRIAGLDGSGADPLPALLATAQRLIDAGCDLIAMPCNTAHLWHERVSSRINIPFLHIADAVAQLLGGARTVGLMGTSATLASKLYQARIGSDYRWFLPDDDEMAAHVMPGVAAVKRGEMERAATLLRPVAQHLAARGAEVIVLGCTEIPLAVSAADASVPLIDAPDALARATVQAALGMRESGTRAAA